MLCAHQKTCPKQLKMECQRHEHVSLWLVLQLLIPFHRQQVNGYLRRQHIFVFIKMIKKLMIDNIRPYWNFLYSLNCAFNSSIFSHFISLCLLSRMSLYSLCYTEIDNTCHLQQKINFRIFFVIIYYIYNIAEKIPSCMILPLLSFM